MGMQSERRFAAARRDDGDHWRSDYPDFGTDTDVFAVPRQGVLSAIAEQLDGGEIHIGQSLPGEVSNDEKTGMLCFLLLKTLKCVARSQ